MRITLTTVVALAATLAPAAEPTKDQLAAAEAKVKAFRAAVAVPSGTTVAGSLDAAKGDFAAAAKSADDLVGSHYYGDFVCIRLRFGIIRECRFQR